MTEPKENWEKERKKYLKENKKLQKELERSENNLLACKLVVLISSRVTQAAKKLSFEFNKKFYNDQMRLKYADVDKHELKQRTRHYRRWQYIIHFAKDEIDPRIGKFRAKYGGDDRQECHEFCLSMKTASRLVSRTFCKVSAVDEKYMKTDVIWRNLRMFTRLYPYKIEYILMFLEINGDIIDS